LSVTINDVTFDNIQVDSSTGSFQMPEGYKSIIVESPISITAHCTLDAARTIQTNSDGSASDDYDKAVNIIQCDTNTVTYTPYLNIYFGSVTQSTLNPVMGAVVKQLSNKIQAIFPLNNKVSTGSYSNAGKSILVACPS
jgi:hypothetical protein